MSAFKAIPVFSRHTLSDTSNSYADDLEEMLPTVYIMRAAAQLSHWGRVTHICVGKLTIIGSDNGLSPGRRQAIIWTNAGILLIWPLETKFSEFFYRNSSIFIQENALENVVCQMASILSRPQCANDTWNTCHCPGNLKRQDWGWNYHIFSKLDGRHGTCSSQTHAKFPRDRSYLVSKLQGSNTLWDLTIRHLIRYRNGAVFPGLLWSKR